MGDVNFKTVLEMNAEEARKFFLKKESYCSISLPDYFDFDVVLAEADGILGSSNLKDISNERELKKLTDVNIKLVANKDGKYSWRPLTILHPVIYVDLVNTITAEENWGIIKNRFLEFQKCTKIECVSIPGESTRNKKDSAEQIRSWWSNFEQAQIKLFLDYNYCIQTDITDCYPSIYTHTIAWALMEKAVAKEQRNCRNALGNVLDKKIQNLQAGQTNGIPQGSLLMDFIAEIVLGYADRLLEEAINKDESIEGFKIIRFRDDYRIFSNNKDVAERILKILSEELLDLNLKLNSRKTYLCEDMIFDAIKPDKLYWKPKSKNFFDFVSKLSSVQNESKSVKNEKEYKISCQMHLLEIKMLGDKFPNCGQLLPALSDFYSDRLELKSGTNSSTDYYVLISIVISIMMKNPRTVKHCVVILHKLIGCINDKKQSEELIKKILSKFEELPNTDLVEIWLQNISARENIEINFGHVLCKKVASDEEKVWNSGWLNSNKQLSERQFINKDKLQELRPKYELNIFDIYSD